MTLTYEEGIDLINRNVSEDSINNIPELRYAGLLYEKVGRIYLYEKKMIRAKHFFKKEIDIYNKLDAHGIIYEKSQFIESHKNMGMILLDTGLYSEAVNEYKLALKELNNGNSLYAKADSTKSAIELEIYLGLGDSSFLLKQYEKSIKYYEDWLKFILDNRLIISTEDLKITLERLQICYNNINNSLLYTKTCKQLKRLSKIENVKSIGLSETECTYVLLGYKKIKNKKIQEDQECVNKTEGKKYHFLDLKANNISKCIKGVIPKQCRYSKSKKYFDIEFDKDICKNCEVNGCNQKKVDRTLKISMKKLMEISIYK